MQTVRPVSGSFYSLPSPLVRIAAKHRRSPEVVAHAAKIDALDLMALGAVASAFGTLGLHSICCTLASFALWAGLALLALYGPPLVRRCAFGASLAFVLTIVAFGCFMYPVWRDVWRVAFDGASFSADTSPFVLRAATVVAVSHSFGLYLTGFAAHGARPNPLATFGSFLQGRVGAVPTTTTLVLATVANTFPTYGFVSSAPFVWTCRVVTALTFAWIAAMAYGSRRALGGRQQPPRSPL